MDSSLRQEVEMYENVFGFSDRPFTTTPFVKHYYAAKAIAQTYAQTRMCIDRASGPVIIVGNAGTGKTLLLNLIAEEYQNQFNVVNLACARLDQRSDLLQSILFELNQPYRSMGEGELRLALIDFLKPSDQSPNGVLLLIDEAHSLAPGLLDEVRLITNFVRDGQPRVRLVIAGNHRLEDKLTDPKLESFNQRIAARCYLENLNYEETQSYIQAHLHRAGGQPERIFTDGAYRAVFEVTEGCPRLINQVCEHSFIMAATRGIKPLDEGSIKEAWWDLQSIPGSWDENEESTTTAAKQDEQWTVLEFGSLDEGNSNESTDGSANTYEISAADEQEKFIQNYHQTSEFEVTEVSDESTDWQDAVEQANADPLEISELQDDLSREVYQLEELTAMESSNDPNIWPAADEIHVDFEDVAYPEDSIPDENEMGETEMLPVAEHEVNSTLEASNLASVQGSLDEDALSMETGLSAKEASGPEKVDEVENPFAEEYEEEEFLIDRYVPLVAEQNRSSLDVTASQLQSIRPPQKSISLEELQADLLGDSVKNPGAKNSRNHDPSQEQSQAEFCEDQLTNTRSAAACASPFDDDFATVRESNHAENEKRVRSKNEYEIIHRRAMEALQSLNPVQSGESESGYSEEPSTRAGLEPDLSEDMSVVSFQSNPTDQTAQSEAFDSDDPGPILTELEAQQNMLSSVLSETSKRSFQLDDDVAESVSIEYPVTQHEQYRNESQNEVPEDDRDIITVSRAEQMPRMEQATEDSEELDQSPPSTGRAVRMNYQQLFDQLRQLPNEE